VPALIKHTIEDTGDFPEQRSDPLRTFWNLDVEELLNRKRVTEFICHWESVRDIPWRKVVYRHLLMET